MDLLQILVPKPEDFHILLKNGEKVGIISYSKIDINFCERVVFQYGEGKTIKSPMITYYIKMSNNEKEKLKTLFNSGDDNIRTIQAKPSHIIIGDKNYKFKVFVTAIPGKASNYGNYSHLLTENSAKVELKLENTDISLFGDVEKEYEGYRINNRFEILDIR